MPEPGLSGAGTAPRGDPGTSVVARAKPPWPKQFAKFVTVGVLNTAVELIVYNGLLQLTSSNPGVALLSLYSTLGVTAAILNSYLLNTRWAFSGQSRETQRGKWRQRLLFLAQAGVNIGINDGVTIGITPLLVGAHVFPVVVAQNLAKVLAMGASSMSSYVMLRLVVFS